MFDWNYSASLIFTRCGWLPAVSAMSSLHQHLKHTKNEKHAQSTNLQIFLMWMFGEDGMCYGQEKYQISSSKPSAHPQSLSTMLCLRKHCLITVPKELWSYQQVPHLPWQFLGYCWSHYFVSDISSSHVRWGPRQNSHCSQSHLCHDAALSKLGLLFECVWRESLTGEGESERENKHPVYSHSGVTPRLTYCLRVYIHMEIKWIELMELDMTVCSTDGYF